MEYLVHVRTPYQHWRDEYLSDKDPVTVDYRELGHLWKELSASLKHQMVIRWLQDIVENAITFTRIVRPSREAPADIEGGVQQKWHIRPSRKFGGKYFYMLRLEKGVITRYGNDPNYREEVLWGCAGMDRGVVDSWGNTWLIVLKGTHDPEVTSAFESLFSRELVNGFHPDSFYG